MIQKRKGKADDRSRMRRSKSLKHYDSRKNRSSTRQALREGRFDDIPAQEKVKPEDPWNWD